MKIIDNLGDIRKFRIIEILLSIIGLSFSLIFAIYTQRMEYWLFFVMFLVIIISSIVMGRKLK